MRILFISAFYPPYIIGGWEQLVEDLNGGLRRRGHETFVLTSSYGTAGEPLLDSGAGVDRSLLLESDLQFYNPAMMLSYRRRVQHNLDATRAAILRWKPDVIFIHVMWNLTRGIAWTAEQLAPGRVVYYVANDWIYAPDIHDEYWKDSAGDPLRRVAKRMIAPLALGVVESDRRRFKLAFERVLCVSAAIRQSVQDHLHLPAQQVQVVYNGVELELFPFAVRPLNRTGLRLLYAGSLVAHKGVHSAIEAMGVLKRRDALNGLHLTLVGGGRHDYEERLRRMVVELGLEDSVHFTGRVVRSDMPAQLAAHDVLLFPSQWPEPLARMTQEAMASGAVVIGTTTGGTGEILVDGETGLVFAPGDAEQLASRILQLHQDPDLFRRLAANARQRVEEKFDFQRMLDQVESCLLEAAALPSSLARAELEIAL